jgi:hypothetical protein
MFSPASRRVAMSTPLPSDGSVDIRPLGRLQRGIRYPRPAKTVYPSDCYTMMSDEELGLDMRNSS